MNELSNYLENALRKIIREEINLALAQYLETEANSKPEMNLLQLMKRVNY